MTTTRLPKKLFMHNSPQKLKTIKFYDWLFADMGTGTAEKGLPCTVVF